MIDPGAVVFGAIGGLCSGRVYPLARAWGSAMPALVYKVVSDQQDSTLTAYSPRRECRVTISCYASDYTTATATMTTVNTILQSWTTDEFTPGTNITTSSITRVSRNEFAEDSQDGVDMPTIVVECDYEITIQED